MWQHFYTPKQQQEPVPERTILLGSTLHLPRVQQLGNLHMHKAGRKRCRSLPNNVGCA